MCVVLQLQIFVLNFSAFYLYIVRDVTFVVQINMHVDLNILRTNI